jgi:hypothetical protein
VGTWLPLQQREELLDAIDYSPEIYPDQPLDILDRDLGDCSTKGDPGIIDQQTGTAVFGPDLTNEAVNLFPARRRRAGES